MSDKLINERPENFFQRIVTALGRIIVSLFVPIATFLGLYGGFIFLRDSGAPQAVITIVAIIWGVGGVAALYIVANFFIMRLAPKWQKRLTPFLFVGPAIAILAWYLFIPTFRSFYLSFFSKLSNEFVGLENYAYVFTDRTMKTAFVNNLMWLVFGTSFAVFFGLLIALLSDRSKFEKVAKSFIFLPMAISFVGAGVIWKFIYAYKPAGASQIGFMNAVVVSLGSTISTVLLIIISALIVLRIILFWVNKEMDQRDKVYKTIVWGIIELIAVILFTLLIRNGGKPVNWLTLRPWNTLFLIVILVWLQTGFAMVVQSAAIKQVPTSLIEAARIDGATEYTIIFKIIIPFIKSTIVTVATTILLLTLKIFDIVFAMTNGLFGTEVLATQQYKQMFKFLHYGRGSAIAIIIVLAVTPVVWYNLKQFGKREVF